MRVSVSIEVRYFKGPEGSIWTNGQFPYQFWCRYLEVFSKVNIIARVKPVEKIDPLWIQVDGKGVSVSEVPYYLGPLEYLRNRSCIRKSLKHCIKADDAIILRVSSHLANCLESIYLKNSRPYGVEVVADPWDQFSPGSVRHFLRPLFRILFYRALRRQCKKTIAAAYVTEFFLQKRYPVSRKSFSTNFTSGGLHINEIPFSAGISDVNVSTNSYLKLPRNYNSNQALFNIGCVGNLENYQKGPDILIKATKICINEGLNINVHFIGGGNLIPKLKIMASNEEVINYITFHGQISSIAKMQSLLDKMDLFVLPSRMEGLPRAMIEAMARGLPCLGTLVGGIPELLPSCYLVPAGDFKALAKLMLMVLKNPSQLIKMSQDNLIKSEKYRESSLKIQRNEYYDCVKKATAEWNPSNDY